MWTSCPGGIHRRAQSTRPVALQQRTRAAWLRAIAATTFTTRVGFTLIDLVIGAGVLVEAFRSERVAWWALYAGLLVGVSVMAGPSHAGATLLVAAGGGLVPHRRLGRRAEPAAHG